MILAGHETSQHAIQALFFCLKTNPEIEKKLRSEIDENFKLGEAYDKDKLNSM